MRGTLGILLAGGAGLRLGAGVAKAEVVVGNMTLRDRALATLAESCDAIVIVSPRARSSAATVEDERWVEDEGSGPLSGIVAAVGADTFERALVLGVDFPLVRPRLLNALLDELQRTRAKAVMSAPRGIPQPLVAAFAPAAAVELKRSFEAGERSITRAMTALGAIVVSDEFLMTHGGGLDEVMNVNTAEDIAAAGRLLAERARAAAEHVPGDRP